MSVLTPEDEILIEKAYALGQKAHKDHTRYSGEPYFIHPSAVGKHLAELGMDAPTVAAALLHDAIEDAGTTPEEIEKELGAEVLFLVEGVTKLGKHKYQGGERHAESLRRLLVATSADVRVLIIKLADRFHNMTTLEHVPEEKRKRIAQRPRGDAAFIPGNGDVIDGTRRGRRGNKDHGNAGAEDKRLRHILRQKGLGGPR